MTSIRQPTTIGSPDQVKTRWLRSRIPAAARQLKAGDQALVERQPTMRDGIRLRGWLIGGTIGFLAILAWPGSVATSPQAPATAPPPVALIVSVDRPGARLDPISYGLITEEINYAYDGGL